MLSPTVLPLTLQIFTELGEVSAQPQSHFFMVPSIFGWLNLGALCCLSEDFPGALRCSSHGILGLLCGTVSESVLTPKRLFDNFWSKK